MDSIYNLDYIFALDLSIANTGIAIFDQKVNLIEIQSIKTNPKETHGNRLKQIADTLIELREKYDTNLVIIERAFSLHNTATQVLYRVHGIVNYIFCDCQQVYYAPNAIKKTITGEGKADKSQVQKVLNDLYPNVKFKDYDQSDAVAIGITHFIKEGTLNYEYITRK